MKMFVTLFLLLSTTLAFSKTVVISDIDDTLKVSHVKNKADAALNAFRTDIPFTGSIELMKFLEHEIKDSNFFYVTNAPKWLMRKSHTKFIQNNGYPEGTIYLKSQYSSEEHKIKTILEILKTEKPDQVIMFGDNGQFDIKFYDTITREAERLYPSMKVFQFIHTLYEKTDTLSLMDEQTAYVTPLGVLSAMANQNITGIQKNKLKNYAGQLAQIILREERGDDALMFPRWYECNNYVYTNNFSSRGLVQKAFDHIEEVCKQ